VNSEAEPVLWLQNTAGPAMSRQKAADQVRERLIAGIRSGQLNVDTRLPSENELARIFGVSRPVIREALVGMQALGLVVSRNGRGTFIAAQQVNPDLLHCGFTAKDLIEVRRLLELPAARIAAERRSEEDVARLSALICALREQDAPRERNKLDAEFHVAVASASGNLLLAKLVGEFRTALESVSLLAGYLGTRREAAHAEHEAIQQAIVRQDPDAAEAAMAAHLAAVETFIRDVEMLTGPKGASASLAHGQGSRKSAPIDGRAKAAPRKQGNANNAR